MKKKTKNIKYVPSLALNELNDIKKKESLTSQAEAWKKMASYSQLGRKANELQKLNISVQLPSKKKRKLFNLAEELEKWL